MGFINFYRPLISRVTEIEKCLTELTKKNKKWK